MRLLKLLPLGIAFPSTFALPNINISQQPEPRGNFDQAWIGKIAGTDCKLEPIEKVKGDRPVVGLKDGGQGFLRKCKPFHREPGMNIKVFWGTGDGTYGGRVSGITVYDAPKCDVGAGHVAFKRGTANATDGEKVCFSSIWNMTLWNREWISMQANDD